MDNIVVAQFDIDSGYVYARTEECNLILVDCDAVQKAYTDNMYERSALDYLIYNDPKAYVELVWESFPDLYLKTSTDYTHLSDLR